MPRFRTVLALALALALAPMPVVAPRSAARADADTEAELTRVGAIVRAGNDEAALAALSHLPARIRDTASARYLAGRLAERTGRLAVAEAAFEAAIDAALPAYAARDAQRRRARLLARIGRCAEAIPLLLAEGSGRARAVAAECALAQGRFDDAIALLEVVDRERPGPVDGVTVRLALAEAVARKGDRARATSLLRTTWLERVGQRDRGVVEAALRALDPAALVLTDAEREAEFTRLVAAGAYTAARDALGSLPAPATDAARLARLRTLADLAMQSRAYDEAASAYTRVFEFSHDDVDSYERARALVRAGDHGRALPLLDTIARTHAREPLGDDARYLAADVALGLDEPDRAIGYVASVRGARANTLRLGLVLFALIKGDAALAKQHIDAVARVDDSFRETRATYLRARIAELERDIDGASRVYRALVAAEPFGYYGLIAATRLRALGAEVALPTLTIGTRPAPPPLPEDVAFFHTLGLVDDAREALRAAEPTLRRTLDLPGLVAMHLAIGSDARAYALVRGDVTASTTPPDERVRQLLFAAYPRPYETEVVAAASVLGIRPAHVYGTMRQESAYDPDARSRAGALGLLQVMPSTARRVAETLGLSADRADPFDPHTNVRLGIGEMAALSARFDAQLPLVIAAYNAGSGRVSRWLPAGRSMPTDLFIERIPFAETRGYVRRVLGHFAVYSAIEGREGDILGALRADVVGH